MEEQIVNLRLQQLTDHLSQDLSLLKEIEDELRLEDNPIRRARYRRDIERLQESASKYEREYAELKSQHQGAMTVNQPLSAEPWRQVDVKLEMLLNGINAVLGNQQTLSAQIQESHQALMNRLDQTQQEIVNAFAAAIDADRLPETELRQLLNAIMESVAILQQRNANLPALREAEQVIRLGSETIVEAKHKLKLMIPLIPLVLNYETELELKGGLNLSSLWEAITKKVKG